jgi:diacylglycerol O-acyltransferase / wax synthase
VRQLTSLDAQFLAVEDGRNRVNLVISNVRGSPVPLFCAGARLEAQYPVSVVVDGVGLNITVLSYRGSLDFGVVGDRELVPDAWELIDDLRAELAAQRGPPRKRVPSAKVVKEASR